MTSDSTSLLDRGTVDVIVREELEKKLKSGKKLRIKLGIDPTGSDLHIGHAVVLRKLRQFQDAGHIAILLIGDYTAKIGDPTGKSETRVILSDKKIEENMKHYVNQAAKILDMSKIELRHNSEWFGKMSMAEILELAAKKTVGQMLHREDFKNRFKANQDISLTEFLYPMMQGYDSVMLESDVEIGGTDQLFNMLVGRDLQKGYECKVLQNIITVPILEGLDGVEKMSKSLNNYIGITEEPNEIYGKVMSITDNAITKYLELATNTPIEKIKEIELAMKKGENPISFKKQLARELVTLYHSLADAEKAEKNFTEIFSNKGLPEDIELREMKESKWNIIDLVSEVGFSTSKGEARRLIQGGGVRINGEKVESIEKEIDLSEEKLLQVGKRKFLNLIAK